MRSAGSLWGAGLSGHGLRIQRLDPTYLGSLIVSFDEFDVLICRSGGGGMCAWKRVVVVGGGERVASDEDKEMIVADEDDGMGISLFRCWEAEEGSLGREDRRLDENIHAGRD